MLGCILMQPSIFFKKTDEIYEKAPIISFMHSLF